MAVTIPAAWALQERLSIEAGGPILEDTDHDIATLSQRLNKLFSESSASVLACGGYGPGQGHGICAPTTLYRGAVRMWGDAGSFVLHALGANFAASVTIGGVGPLCTVGGGAAVQWYSSPSSGWVPAIAISADDVVEIGVSVRVVGGTGLQFWILEEEAVPLANLPDYDHAYTSFQQLDETFGNAGRGLGGWHLQTLRRNVEECARRRRRGTSRFHPVRDEEDGAYTLSSIFRRADGPYLWQAAPWEALATVVVELEGVDEDYVITAFSEHELDRMDEWFDLTGSRAQVLGAGSGVDIFVFKDLALRTMADGLCPNRIWIGFKSLYDLKTATPIWYSPVPFWPGQDHWQTDGQRELYVFDSSWSNNEPIDWPVGRAVAVGQFDSWSSGSAEEQSGLAGERPKRWYDFACNQGFPQDPADSSQILVSPSPNARPPLDVWGGQQINTYNIGYFTLYSVWIDAYPDLDELSAVDRYDAAHVGELPPANLVQQVARLHNDLVMYGTPAICTRHAGQRWDVPTRTVALYDFHQRGRYHFAHDNDVSRAWQTVCRAAIPSDLGLEKAFAQALFVAARAQESNEDEIAFLSWRIQLYCNAGTTTGTVITAQAPSILLHGQARTIDEWDAVISAQAASYNPANPGDLKYYEHSYVHQYQWADGRGSGRVWQPSPICELLLPITGGPAWLELQLDISTLDIDLWVITGGAGFWYGPRL